MLKRWISDDGFWKWLKYQITMLVEHKRWISDDGFWKWLGYQVFDPNTEARCLEAAAPPEYALTCHLCGHCWFSIGINIKSVIIKKDAIGHLQDNLRYCAMPECRKAAANWEGWHESS